MKYIIIIAILLSSCFPMKPAFERTDALMMMAIVHKVEGTRVMLRFTAATNPEIVAFDWFEAYEGHNYKKGQVLFFNTLDNDRP